MLCSGQTGKHNLFISSTANGERNKHGNPEAAYPTVRFAHSRNEPKMKLNSGLASTEVKTGNSEVVIFVKIITENLIKCFALHLTKWLKNKNYITKDLL